MPIYEYECEKCKTIFETIVTNNSQDSVVCKNCGGSELRKLISTIGIKISGVKHSSGDCQPRGGFS